MKKNGTLTILASVMVLAGLFVFGATLSRAFFYTPTSEITVPDSAAAPIDMPPSELPERLVIPSLGIDTDVQHVGVGRSGNMAVPDNYSDAGWYRLGTVPGQIGSAVMDGHVDNGFGLAGVFKRLQELEKGDDVYVISHEGTRLHFEVVEVARYPYEDVPLERVFNRADRPRLNLVTCTGRWVRSDETYDHRIVVYTELVGTE